MGLGTTILATILACQAGGGYFTAFPGEYQVRLKIRDAVFNDVLVIDHLSRDPGTPEIVDGIETAFGTYEVPGRFKSELEEAQAVVTVGNGFDFRFKITARENGKEYPVYFHFTGPSLEPCSFAGEAYLEPGGAPLGTAEVIKTARPCRCS